MESFRHSRTSSKAFGDARFGFCPNLITFAQISPNPTKYAQIFPILSKIFFFLGNAVAHILHPQLLYGNDFHRSSKLSYRYFDCSRSFQVTVVILIILGLITGKHQLIGCAKRKQHRNIIKYS